MPVGLIGEDFFVSWLVASDLWRGKVPSDEGHVVFFTIELVTIQIPVTLAPG